MSWRFPSISRKSRIIRLKLETFLPIMCNPVTKIVPIKSQRRSKLYTGFIISFPSFFSLLSVWAVYDTWSTIENLRQSARERSIGPQIFSSSRDLATNYFWQSASNRFLQGLRPETLSSKLLPRQNGSRLGELSSVQHQLKCDVSSKILQQFGKLLLRQLTPNRFYRQRL